MAASQSERPPSVARRGSDHCQILAASNVAGGDISNTVNGSAELGKALKFDGISRVFMRSNALVVCIFILSYGLLSS